MSFSAGDKLGPYEIIGVVGKGGMGEVYRATDTRLHREVAVKVSAERFNDRFEREARAVASLNHPNICTLHDVGPNYLVMELIEGETLAERIKQGGLPLEEALGIAKQIAAALEAAHEKGIVHRDLKPANVKVTPDGAVKVLDFGLAKMADATPVSGSNPEQSPTMTLEAATRVGAVMGTAGYMAPEQAKGKPVDKRADIWAFGVVLYEMLAGRRLFQGEDVSEMLASVIKETPDLEAAPPRVHRLLRKCLEKDPKKRLRDIGDVWMLLDEPVAPAAVPAAARTGWRWPAATGVLAIAGLLLAVVHFREQPPAPPDPVTFDVTAPPNAGLTSFFAISPDGKKLAFTARSAEGVQLWVQSFESGEARPLTRTAALPYPFWSSDSKYLAYHLEGNLRKISAAGGATQILCSVPDRFAGGSWNRDGTIVFGAVGSGIMVVSEDGGTATPVTALDSSRSEVGHAAPSFLPDGKHFLYYRDFGQGAASGIYIGSLDLKPEQQSGERLVASPASAMFVPAAGATVGQLLYLQDTTLTRRPFDSRKLEFAGGAAPVAEGVGHTGRRPDFSVSETGAVAQRKGTGLVLRIGWFDRAGKPIDGDLTAFQNSMDPVLSPDGKRFAAYRPRSGNGDIWVNDLATGRAMQLTFDTRTEVSPVWSPDGSQIAYYAERGENSGIYRKAAAGSGEEQLLTKTRGAATLSDWSRDGRYLLYQTEDALGDIWVLPMEGERTPWPYLVGAASNGGRFSPDGRYVAERSGKTGQVFVRPFEGKPAGNVQWLVSGNGAGVPRWSADGKQIYFFQNQQMISVPVSTGASFQAGTPRTLFTARDIPPTAPARQWDVSRDGSRFLVVTVPMETGVGAIKVTLNWRPGVSQ